MGSSEAVLAADRFRPSDYTAALLNCVLENGAWARGARVLDVGCGSGVLLAAAGSMGAVHLTGVDIEADAVVTAGALLDAQGFAGACDIRQGAMYDPVEGQRFDLVLANLPHFPMDEAAVDGRLASWSAGGPDGRRLVDRFIDGLAAHLAPDGRAMLMHNVFIRLDRTRDVAARHGLKVEVLQTIMVPLPKAKLAVMTPEVLARETGQSIHRFGDYAFGAVSVLAIRHAADGGGRS
ncbi:methyltransferase [Chachezhania sediminis]|uniref:methyltransferase n=1 Tax=Chachezhania sediminis TaxID=2599291 RepID=UPI00131DC074|nr:methyltransferase [Chachezhania sediminis]